MNYQTLKPYILAAAVGASALFGGKAAAQLPISADTKAQMQYETTQKLDSLLQVYDTQIATARDAFNAGISDNYLSRKEQDSVLNTYDAASQTLEEINGIASKTLHAADKHLSAEDSTLAHLIYKNLHNKHPKGDTLSLQYALQKEGMDVDVQEGDKSVPDDFFWVGLLIQLAGQAVYHGFIKPSARG